VCQLAARTPCAAEAQNRHGFRAGLFSGRAAEAENRFTLFLAALQPGVSPGRNMDKTMSGSVQDAPRVPKPLMISPCSA
jgi:hypothetical protein